MPGIVLAHVKDTARFYVYTPAKEQGVGSLYISKELMEYGPEPAVRVTWPEPPESGR